MPENELLPQVGTSKEPALVVRDDSEFSNFLDTARFNQLWRVAVAFSRTQLVPTHFQGHPDDCFVACQMAFRLKIDPLMFMQKSYIVHGRPGIEGQLKIALANKYGPFEGPIRWTFDTNGHPPKWCTAYAVDKRTGDRCEYTLDWKTVQAEGWNKPGKNGFPSKWETMPEKMFRYRSASWLIDLYCPDVVLGLATADELEESAGDLRALDITPKTLPQSPIDLVEPTPTPIDWPTIAAAMSSKADPDLVRQFADETATIQKANLFDFAAEMVRQPAEAWKFFQKWTAKHRQSAPEPVQPEVPAKPVELEPEPVNSRGTGDIIPTAVKPWELTQAVYDYICKTVEISTIPREEMQAAIIDYYGAKGLEGYDAIADQMRSLFGRKAKPGDVKNWLGAVGLPIE